MVVHSIVVSPSTKKFDQQPRVLILPSAGPPVVGGEGVVEVGEAGRAELTCTATGVPAPQTVLWTRQGNELTYAAISVPAPQVMLLT